jgi:hypothetical protein
MVNKKTKLIERLRWFLIRRLVGKIKPTGLDFEIRSLTPEEKITADLIAKHCAGRCEIGIIVKKLYGDHLLSEYHKNLLNEEFKK